MPDTSPYESFPTYFVAMYCAGDKYDDLAANRAQIQREHVEYQVSNQQQGSLVLGGPFIEEVGGLAVFRGGSREEVVAIINADPAVQAGLYRVALHEYKIVLNTLSKE